MALRRTGGGRWSVLRMALAAALLVAAWAEWGAVGARAADLSLPQGWGLPAGFPSVFRAAGVRGSFLAYSVLDDRWSCHDPARCRTGFLPASTFKLANALVGLDSGVLSGPDAVIPWDGVRRDIEAWNRDHTLATALKDSCVPYFQEVARRVGAERMRAWLDALGYGNGDMSSGLDRFWLEGGLRITPEGQVDFLRRLYHETLPCSKEAQRTLKELIVLDEGEGWTLRGKTGLTPPSNGEPATGWLVGWLEQAGDVLFFATCLTGPDAGPSFREARLAVTRGCLRELGFLEKGGPAPVEVPAPPVAEQRPFAMTVNGDVRQDPWFWLRTRDEPAVMSYLEAENAYMRSFMRSSRLLQDRLFHEMVGRMKETDLSVPVRRGAWLYYHRTEKGKQYPLHCRRGTAEGSPEQIILDENVAAGDAEFFATGTVEPSPSGKLVAWSADTSGAEHYVLRFRDPATGKDLPDVIPDTLGTVAWANDDATVFYVTRDAAERPCRVWRHVLGTLPAKDDEVYFEADAGFEVGVGETKDRKFIVIQSDSSTSSEARILSADTPSGDFRVFAKRRSSVEYSLTHQGSDFLVTTNDGAVNFKVYRVPDGSTSRRDWKVFVPGREDVKVDGVEAFAGHVVVYEREGGLRTMRVWDAATGEFRSVDFPEPVYSYYEGLNPEYDATTLRFTYTSMLTPDSVYDMDLTTFERELRKRREVLGGYDPDLYVQERVWARSHDGVLVPMSLVYRRGLRRDGSSPCYLTGYGAYGIPSDPYFSSNRLSLLDRGFVYAIAHIRGGEEMGRRWYLDGKLLKKRNSFLDFLACAEYLAKERYTRARRTAISGGSAGGLLVGASVTMRPTALGCVVADVPFVDALSTMLDPSLPLTVQEYEEWGNPEQKVYYDYIKSYSPYDNVRAVEYPPMLVIGGLNDPRVSYWEPAKFTAKLRATKTDQNPLVLKTNMGAGHQGASGRYSFLADIAFEFAYVLRVFGMAD